MFIIRKYASLSMLKIKTDLRTGVKALQVIKKYIKWL